MEPVSMAVGGGLVLLGWALGRLPRRPRAERPPEPKCGCTHHLAHHDPATKVCHGTVQLPKYDEDGYKVGYTYEPCSCRQYSGPIPVTELFTPQTLPPADT